MGYPVVNQDANFLEEINGLLVCILYSPGIGKVEPYVHLVPGFLLFVASEVTDTLLAECIDTETASQQKRDRWRDGSALS
jgi:hypothetical protein